MIGTIISILAPFWRPIAALFGGLIAYGKGRADGKAKADARDMKANIDTRRRMDDADTGIGATDDAVLDRLRDHAKK